MPAIKKEVLERTRKLIDAAVEAKHRELAQNILAELKRRTPVDTGAARAGWYVGTSSLEQDLVFASLEEIKAYTATDISNRMPYVGRLNHGSSQKAPAGFVEDAVTFAVVHS